MKNTAHIAKRSEISKESQWDLSSLFKNTEEWEDAFSKVEPEIEKMVFYKSKLSESVNIFTDALEFFFYINRKFDKLFTYAHLKSDEDKRNQQNLGLWQRAIALKSKLSEYSSFLIPEIQAIDLKKIKYYLENEKLKKYGFFIKKIQRHKPFTLSEEIEEVLAVSEEIAYAPYQIFSQLDNADMKFGMIEDDKGESVELTHGNFITFLMSSKREIRKKAFFQYYEAYQNNKHCIATSLGTSIRKDYILSKVRKYSTTRDASLFEDNVPSDVYDNLICTVKENLEPLFKYYRFRKKVLDLDKLHFYDIYAPLVDDVKINIPYEDAVEICAKAVKPLGKEYSDKLTQGLLGGWVDRYENQGKKNGAYSSGCYDSFPYILINYKDNNINSLYTLMHEAGHSMHTYYSNKNQPYVYHDYTIFVAEVASTFNEMLLSSYLLEFYKDDPKMKAYIINREIDNIRATLFRQTMFAEFESITHKIAEENQPITLDVLTSLYSRLLLTYFGDTVVTDDPIMLECLRIPHFYSAYYVYKYATGISASIAIFKNVQQEGDKAKNTYLDFLSMGCSRYPLDELYAAGVDMKLKKPVKKAIEYFDNLVDNFIEIAKV